MYTYSTVRYLHFSCTAQKQVMYCTVRYDRKVLYCTVLCELLMYCTVLYCVLFCITQALLASITVPANHAPTKHALQTGPIKYFRRTLLYLTGPLKWFHFATQFRSSERHAPATLCCSVCVCTQICTAGAVRMLGSATRGTTGVGYVSSVLSCPALFCPVLE